MWKCAQPYLRLWSGADTVKTAGVCFLFSLMYCILFVSLTLRACFTKRGCSLSEPRIPPLGVPCLPFLSCFLASSSPPARSPLPTSKLGQQNVEAWSSLQPQLKCEIKAEVKHAAAGHSVITHFPSCIRGIRFLPCLVRCQSSCNTSACGFHKSVTPDEISSQRRKGRGGGWERYGEQKEG